MSTQMARIDELVREGGYVLHDSWASLSHVSGIGDPDAKVAIRKIPGNNREEVLAEMRAQGLRPATLLETLRYCNAHDLGEDNDRETIVVLGSDCHIAGGFFISGLPHTGVLPLVECLPVVCRDRYRKELATHTPGAAFYNWNVFPVVRL